MKPILLFIFIFSISFSVNCQEINPKDNLIYLEKKYKDKDQDQADNNDSDSEIIKGRVNRRYNLQRTNTYVIQYDFKTGVFDRNQIDLRVNTPVIFKIVNINRLAYDVSITPVDLQLSGTRFFDDMYSLPLPSTSKSKEDVLPSESSLLKETEDTQSQLKEEDLKGENKPANLNDIKLIKEKEYLEGKLTEVNNRISDSKDSLNIKIDALNESDKENTKVVIDFLITDDISVYQEKVKTLEEKDGNLIEILTITKGLIKDIEEKNSLERKLEEVDKINNETLKSYWERYQKFATTYSELNEIYSLLTDFPYKFNYLQSVVSNPYLTYKSYKDNYQKKLQNFNISNYKKLLKKFNTYSNELEVLYTITKNTHGLDDIFTQEGKTKFLEPLGTRYRIFGDWKKVINHIEISSKIEYMEEIIQLLDERSTYSVVSVPIQPTRDAAQFTVLIKEKNEKDSKKVTAFTYTEFTRGGVRLDVGLGLGASLVPGAKTYELANFIENSAQIKSKSGNTFLPSIVGIATLSFRSNRIATFGVSGGMGVSTTNGSIMLGHFYFGPSLIVGRYDRITFTAGGSINRVDVLKSGYELDKFVIIDDASHQIDNFLTEKYKLGLFLSVSYNLTKGVKDNYQNMGIPSEFFQFFVK